ncbi:hypothetical protein GUITHDRAFT_154930, partial [Guillardia theta CCMP2712]
MKCLEAEWLCAVASTSHLSDGNLGSDAYLGSSCWVHRYPIDMTCLHGMCRSRSRGSAVVVSKLHLGRSNLEKSSVDLLWVLLKHRPPACNANFACACERAVVVAATRSPPLDAPDRRGVVSFITMEFSIKLQTM